MARKQKTPLDVSHLKIEPKLTGEMSWTIHDDDGNEIYRIEPYYNHLCYELKRAKRINKDGKRVVVWETCGYPWDLYGACLMIQDYMLKAKAGKSKDIEEMKAIIMKTATLISSALGEGVMNDDRR